MSAAATGEHASGDHIVQATPLYLPRALARIVPGVGEAEMKNSDIHSVTADSQSARATRHHPYLSVIVGRQWRHAMTADQAFFLACHAFAGDERITRLNDRYGAEGLRMLISNPSEDSDGKWLFDMVPTAAVEGSAHGAGSEYSIVAQCFVYPATGKCEIRL